MNVSELIEILKTYKPDMEIVVFTNGGYDSVNSYDDPHLQLVSLVKEYEWEWYNPALYSSEKNLKKEYDALPRKTVCCIGI